MRDGAREGTLPVSSKRSDASSFAARLAFREPGFVRCNAEKGEEDDLRRSGFVSFGIIAGFAHSGNSSSKSFAKYRGSVGGGWAHRGMVATDAMHMNCITQFTWMSWSEFHEPVKGVISRLSSSASRLYALESASTSNSIHKTRAPVAS